MRSVWSSMNPIEVHANFPRPVDARLMMQEGQFLASSYVPLDYPARIVLGLDGCRAF